jgi:hypothetical protein
MWAILGGTDLQCRTTTIKTRLDWFSQNLRIEPHSLSISCDGFGKGGPSAVEAILT